MNRISLHVVFAALFTVAPGVTSARTQILYDAGLGTLPSAQGWVYAAVPGASTQELVKEAVLLNTTIAHAERAGYATLAPEPLEPNTGFTLLFTVQVHSETHASPDRAGFSVILLGSDQKGIELGFSTNAVFAQSDSPLFTRAEMMDHDMNAALSEYALNIRNDRYSLSTDGTVILSGSVRDYTAFDGLLDPYETPNFIFLGDNTSSARGAFSLSRAALVYAPEIEFTPPNIIAWNGIPGQTYTVEESQNLVDWSPEAVVESATSVFTYTNRIIASRSFHRIVFP